MDALGSLLYDVRADGAVFGRTILSPPWSVRFATKPQLTLVTMLRGSGWVMPDGAEPHPLGPQDSGVVLGPEPFTITDDPAAATIPSYVANPDGSCTGPGELTTLGARTCGDADGTTVVLTAAYRGRTRISDRLLGALPRVLVVPFEGQPCPILDLTMGEIDRDGPGQQPVLDRLLDLLLLSTLREGFARPDNATPAWYAGLTDPVVGTALRLLHEDPARPWTVALLAEHASVSRATFARRFRELLGEPPMAYLAGWRLALATDLLHRTEATVDSVARQVGYASAFALSAAFKRHYGTRPSELRARAA